MSTVWVVRGGDIYDDGSHVIGVCATKDLAEELRRRTEAFPEQWATIDEEEILTELPEWAEPHDVVTYEATFRSYDRSIGVSSRTEFGYVSDFPVCDPDGSVGDAYGTDRDAVIGFVRRWCEDRHFRNVPIVEL
ncbi:hypothetical protein ICV35_25055 [Rhodococcus ruber]|uniref:hypothetical protein n=1 Tax=Rhodococcus ruber TaxID=1830 RepID=UPI00177F47BB|nr:hypothetical protein [Rhodococcus ruber]MBD8056919.1 hypothetical protein [Rhodococcus ruber]